MPSVYLFNPENDLALAADVANYTPPSAALDLRHAGELLPLIWAQPGDYILVDQERLDVAVKFAASLRRDVEIVAQCPGCVVPKPWGWSKDARRRFLKAGVSSDMLPTDVQLDLWRKMSHRRMTIPIYKTLGLEPPSECRTVEEAIGEIDRLNGKAMIKLPWSSSGRGVFRSDSFSPDALRRQIGGMIGRQGSVMVERLRDCINDFAALYYISDGVARFKSLSLFTTGAGGAYSGNIVADDSRIMAAINCDPMDCVARVGVALTETIGGNYTGWVGVDMLTYRGYDGEVTVEPCVEVNLRRTMGVVAYELRKKGLNGFLYPMKGETPADCIILSPGCRRFHFVLAQESAVTEGR